MDERAGHGIWPVPVVVNRWSVGTQSGHGDPGTTPLVPEPMIDGMCWRDATSSNHHAVRHSQGCGIGTLADTAVISHPFRVVWQGRGGWTSNQSSTETGTRGRSEPARPMG